MTDSITSNPYDIKLDKLNSGNSEYKELLTYIDRENERFQRERFPSAYEAYAKPIPNDVEHEEIPEFAQLDKYRKANAWTADEIMTISKYKIVGDAVSAYRRKYGINKRSKLAIQRKFQKLRKDGVRHTLSLTVDREPYTQEEIDLLKNSTDLNEAIEKYSKAYPNKRTHHCLEVYCRTHFNLYSKQDKGVYGTITWSHDEVMELMRINDMVESTLRYARVRTPKSVEGAYWRIEKKLKKLQVGATYLYEYPKKPGVYVKITSIERYRVYAEFENGTIDLVNPYLLYIR